jgi:hypothetical protein
MLFRRLFNFRSEEIQQAERRLISRYTVTPEFPLSLRVKMEANEIDATVVDLSGGGVGLSLGKVFELQVGQSVRLEFRLDDEPFHARATVRHARVKDGRTHCGLAVDLDDLEGRKAYLQLLIPVSIGCSLARVALSRAPIEEPGLERLVFEGESNSRMIV